MILDARLFLWNLVFVVKIPFIIFDAKKKFLCLVREVSRPESLETKLFDFVLALSSINYYCLESESLKRIEIALEKTLLVEEPANPKDFY